MTIAFRDHEGFHRAAMTMAAAGAAAGLAAHVVSASLPPAVLGGAVGAVLGAAFAGGERRADRLGARLMLVAAGGLGATLVSGVPGLAILALATALALHVGAPRSLWVSGTLVAGAVLMIAGFAGLQIAGAEETAALPGWLVSVLAASASALVAVAALVPRHLIVDGDPVQAAVAALPAGIDGEVRDLVMRGRGVWSDVEARLVADPGSRQLVRDGVLRLVDVAHRSAALPLDLTASAAAIAARRAELDARAAAASDEIAAAQYRQALLSLDDQERDLAAIRTGRERLVARMHNYLSGLERFRLAVVKHHAASASELAAEARPLLGEVSELAAELGPTA
jgi:hypothetical protein